MLDRSISFIQIYSYVKTNDCSLKMIYILGPRQESPFFSDTFAVTEEPLFWEKSVFSREKSVMFSILPLIGEYVIFLMKIFRYYAGSH